MTPSPNPETDRAGALAPRRDPAAGDHVLVWLMGACALALILLLGGGALLLHARGTGPEIEPDSVALPATRPDAGPRPKPDLEDHRGPVPMTEEVAREASKAFYETKGEFHGEYEMQAIEALRLVRIADDRWDAHVRYRFSCIRKGPCCCGANGYDQRIFTLVWSDGDWRATHMSGYMTARVR